MGKTCHSCQSKSNQSNPQTALLHPWIWSYLPWRHIHVHVNFAGPFLGHMFLVTVDPHSKWPEVELMTSTFSKKTIEVLRSLFACHRLPKQLVSDNRPQFTSDEFEKFLKGNQVKHILMAPYHPSSNGLAKRFVQRLKHSLKASIGDGRSLCHRLAEFLFEY